MQEPVIRRADVSDAQVVAEIGARTFSETFAHLYPPEDLAGFLADAGLVVQEGGAWERFAHRVDSSIRRDLIVAVKP